MKKQLRVFFMFVILTSFVGSLFSTKTEAAAVSLPPGGYSANFGYEYFDSNDNWVSWQLIAKPAATLDIELQRVINGKWTTVAHTRRTIDHDTWHYVYFYNEYSGSLKQGVPYRILVTNRSSYTTTVTGYNAG
jgi:hypothetical protein